MVTSPEFSLYTHKEHIIIQQMLLCAYYVPVIVLGCRLSENNTTV